MHGQFMKSSSVTVFNTSAGLLALRFISTKAAV